MTTNDDDQALGPIAPDQRKPSSPGSPATPMASKSTRKTRRISRAGWYRAPSRPPQFTSGHGDLPTLTEQVADLTRTQVTGSGPSADLQGGCLAGSPDAVACSEWRQSAGGLADDAVHLLSAEGPQSRGTDITHPADLQ
jgi:hypothetical protein